EATSGAAAIDLVVQRFGYDGPIDLELVGDANGLRLANGRIAAAATEARVHLVAGEGWTPQSIAALELQGTAIDAASSDAPKSLVTVDHLAWQRAKTPHVPFPLSG